MPWGRVDDTHYDHPKTLAVLEDEHGLEALGLYWLLISYCNRHLTDGAFSLASARHVCHYPRVPELIALLTAHRLVDDGPRIHDYLSFNKSRAQVEEDRRQWRIRQEKARLSRESHGVTLPLSPRESRESHAEVTRESRSPVPTPVPVPIPGRPIAAKSNGTTKAPPLDEETIAKYRAIRDDATEPDWKREAAIAQLGFMGVTDAS